MSNRPVPRRGLGRGLGSLIPTAPRPEEADQTDPWQPDAGEETPEREADQQSAGAQVSADEPVRAQDVGPDSVEGREATAAGSADWIGVPLPGDMPRQRSHAAADDGAHGGAGDDGAHGGADDARVPPQQAEAGTWGGTGRPGGIDSAGATAPVIVGAQHRDPEASPSPESPESPEVLESPESPEVPESPESPESPAVGGDPAWAADASFDGDGTGLDTGGPSDIDRKSDRRSEPGSAAALGAFFAELPVEEVRPNPRQPREVFDEDAMAELVHSVKEVGLLQPVVVRPAEDGGYELIMGERRWRATRQAGLDTIPAIVRETGDDALLRDALLENLHRAELNALEEAAAYQQLLEDFGCTHDELASRIGRSRPQISNTLRLLKLSPAVQRRVAAGVLSAGHARALLGVADAQDQDRLAARVVAEGISVRGLEEIVSVGDHGSPAPAPRRRRPTAPGLEDLSARLSDRLETRVKVDLGRRKGRITIEFASLPDLERIVGLVDPPT